MSSLIAEWFPSYESHKALLHTRAQAHTLLLTYCICNELQSSQPKALALYLIMIHEYISLHNRSILPWPYDTNTHGIEW